MSLLERLTSFSQIIFQPPKDYSKTIDEIKQLFVHPAKDLGLAWVYLTKLLQHCYYLRTDYHLWFLWTIPEAMKSIQVLSTGKHYICLERLLRFFMYWYCEVKSQIPPQDPHLGLIPHYLILARTFEPCIVENATLCLVQLLERCGTETILDIQQNFDLIRKSSDIIGAKSFHGSNLKSHTISTLMSGLWKSWYTGLTSQVIHEYASCLLLDEFEDIKIAILGRQQYFSLIRD